MAGGFFTSEPPRRPSVYCNMSNTKDSRQEEKGTTEGEMVGRHHQLDGYEFEQDLGVGNLEGWDGV